MKTPARFLTQRRRAFSLVEVTLALGISSFALLTILGLMPTGLQTMRQAMDSTVESQIVREIRAKVQQTSFASLSSSFTDREFFFSEAGTPTEKNATDKRYTVKTSVEEPVYPGSQEARAGSMSSIAIEITTGLGEVKAVRRQHLLVANHGR